MAWSWLRKLVTGTNRVTATAEIVAISANSITDALAAARTARRSAAVQIRGRDLEGAIQSLAVLEQQFTYIQNEIQSIRDAWNTAKYRRD